MKKSLENLINAYLKTEKQVEDAIQAKPLSLSKILNKLLQHDELSKIVAEKYNEYINKRLSQETLKAIKDNYNTEVLYKIIPLLIDASLYINPKKLNSEASKAFQKRLKEAIKGCDTLLLNGLLSDRQRQDIEAIKRLHEAGLNSIKHIKVDSIREAIISNAETTSLLNCDPELWTSAYNSIMQRTIIERKKGRPENIALKKCIKKIYKLLTKDRPTRQDTYKEFAKQLTANILNEVFALKLTIKDIKNSL